jgi:hypothetical protein
VYLEKDRDYFQEQFDSVWYYTVLVLGYKLLMLFVPMWNFNPGAAN